MPTIVCYGDSNTWGAVPQPCRGAGGRFGHDERWPGVLRNTLGSGYEVIEEGLNGRTTCRDDPVEGDHKNGARFLQVVLETHAPFDLLIIKLGTNDLKTRLAMQAGDIADGAGILVDIARRSTSGRGGAPPPVLLVSPAPLAGLTWLAEMFDGGAEKSLKLGAEMERVARERNVHFVDAGAIVSSSGDDGIHLDGDAHAKLGAAIALRILEILSRSR
jgi:lysophospholipase L1-like esterase